MYVAASRRRLTDVTRVPMSLPSRCALTPHTDFETVARDYVASVSCDVECKDGLVERQYSSAVLGLISHLAKTPNLNKRGATFPCIEAES